MRLCLYMKAICLFERFVWLLNWVTLVDGCLRMDVLAGLIEVPQKGEAHPLRCVLRQTHAVTVPHHSSRETERFISFMMTVVGGGVGCVWEQDPIRGRLLFWFTDFQMFAWLVGCCCCEALLLLLYALRSRSSLSNLNMCSGTTEWMSSNAPGFLL